jgi:hypothetical protein
MTSEDYDKLTDEEKRIKIARLHGWKYRYGKTYGRKMWFFGRKINGAIEHWSLLPDYLNDLNAMHKAETERIIGNVVMKICYMANLSMVRNTYEGVQLHFCATARQRAKAFVLTMTEGE